jgi:AcrR family transcriptional regulator
MSTESGLRERKKQRTRQALTSAAARLFANQGYERTTVAEIAAAAEVSTRTFFSYFPSKEDVLFADTEERLRLAGEVLARPRPGEPAPELLLRAIERMLGSEAFQQDLTGELGSVRLRLIGVTPALQAAAMWRVLRAQGTLAQALHRAYPAQLTPTTAAATVGALLGALLATALVCLQQGDDLPQLTAELRRAATIARYGVGAADR